MKISIKKCLAAAAFAMFFISASHAQSASLDKPITIWKPSDFKWIPDDLVGLPTGPTIMRLEGNRNEKGPFTLRIKIPANYQSRPFSHSEKEHITVISGTFYMGLGDHIDPSKATALPAGSFVSIEPGVMHFSFTKDDGAIIQMHGMGPSIVTFAKQ